MLDLSNYATKKELDHATDFVALKAEFDKLDVNKLVNVPTRLNNLKTKVDDLDVGKLKTVLVDLRKLSDVVEKTKFNTLKTKVNLLDRAIPNATALIHINQYNTDKQNLEKKNWRCW